MIPRRTLISIVLLSTLFAFPLVVTSRALAEECAGGFIRSSIAGEGNRVRLSLEGRDSGCGSSLRACASRWSWAAVGAVVPAVVGPGAADEPTTDDGGIG
jgi:hypothetical protein